MNNYLELALKKEKKPASLEKIIERIEKIKSDDARKDVFLSDEEKGEVARLLDEAVLTYDVYKTPSGNYVLYSKTSFRKGRFYANKDGSGRVSIINTYVDRDGKLVVKNEQYSVSREYVSGAIDGDFVLIDTANNNRICEVIKRNLEYVPGEVYKMGNQYYLRPADKRKQNLVIALKDEAIEGERVAVSIDEQTADNYCVAHVVSVFNHKDDPNEDIIWEAFKMGVDDSFSNESLEQLERLPDDVRDVDRIGREDLTGIEAFTIDDVTTKDMDDAVSCYINENGNYVLGVHITDIAALIPYGSPLDIDGFKKGNSYYPGGVVFPNYPRKVSNKIGSLNEGVDRLTISDIIEISPSGEIVSYRLVPTVINSRLKMRYDKVNDLLVDGIVDDDYREHVDTLKMLERLASILHKKRINRGASEFNRPEPKGIYSSNGNITGIGVRHQGVAENIIEELMLIANEERAKFYSRRGIPCMYRVHDEPDAEKIQKFLNMLSAIGLAFSDYSAEELSTNKQAFQKLIKHAASAERLSGMLTTELIKTMSRAKYSAINTGHSGLSMKYYSQGTSPVRRYGDKTNQHIAWDCVFTPDPGRKKAHEWEKRLPEIAEWITHTERVADDLEKEVRKMQYAEYMSNFIGEEFEATVIALSGDCLTVQLDNLVEGTVRVRDMNGMYVHSEDSYSLVSLDGYDNYYIGDRLLLKLKRASKETKKIDFEVVDKIYETQVQNSEEINKSVKVLEKKKRDKRSRRRN